MLNWRFEYPAMWRLENRLVLDYRIEICEDVFQSSTENEFLDSSIGPNKGILICIGARSRIMHYLLSLIRSVSCDTADRSCLSASSLRSLPDQARYHIL